MSLPTQHVLGGRVILRLSTSCFVYRCLSRIDVSQVEGKNPVNIDVINASLPLFFLLLLLLLPDASHNIMV